MDGFLLGGIRSAHATTPWHNVPLLAGGAPEKHSHGILPQARHNDAPARHRREAFVQRFIANETCVVPVRHQRGAFAQSPATSETYNGTPARHGSLKEMARAAAFASKQQLGQFFHPQQVRVHWQTIWAIRRSSGNADLPVQCPNILVATSRSTRDPQTLPGQACFFAGALGISCVMGRQAKPSRQGAAKGKKQGEKTKKTQGGIISERF